MDQYVMRCLIDEMVETMATAGPEAAETLMGVEQGAHAMFSGYAYEQIPNERGIVRGWMRATDTEWEIVAYTPDGGEAWIGQRQIDGVTHAVFRCTDGVRRAQLAHMCRRAS